jgi:N-acetylmuramoyl-L-alanine amidase
MLTAAVLCLAQNIFFEARSESIQGQIMVAEVTLNRVSAENYPDTICEVVYQKKQFSWTHDGATDNPEKLSLTERRAWRRVKHLAFALTLYPELLEETGATHFHSTSVRPRWSHRLRHIKQVGNHVFYAQKK